MGEAGQIVQHPPLRRMGGIEFFVITNERKISQGLMKLSLLVYRFTSFFF